MAVDVKDLIAAISPDIYCDNTPDAEGKILVDKVKKIVRETGDYLKAAKVIGGKLRQSSYIDVEYLPFEKAAFDKVGLLNPIESHFLRYDAFSQNLEPIYFWILDFVNDYYGGSKKLLDNFIASEGSGYFGEMQARATKMQTEGMNMMTTANAVLRSVLNLVYDLKEWNIKLIPYNVLKNSKDKNQIQSAKLALKQNWMDTVDVKRGNTSLKGMAQQTEYVTIIDAFMAAESTEKVADLDLNERVRRIILQRIPEFERWIKESEDALRKRFEIEKKYLKSQVNSLKLYSRWAKPYLKAARKLEQQAMASADLVTNFNTAVFELVLMAKGRKYDPAGDIANGELPKSFDKVKARKFYPIAIVEFRFRSIPDRTQQAGGGYTYRGKAEIGFTSFALNQDEMAVFEEQLDKDDLADVYHLIEGATEESLGEIMDDVNQFLGEDKKDKKKKEDDVDDNPFTALFSFFKKKGKDKDKDFSKGIPKDNYYESVFRSQVILDARKKCRKLYDTYKKVHGMPAFEPTMGQYSS